MPFGDKQVNQEYHKQYFQDHKKDLTKRNIIWMKNHLKKRQFHLYKYRAKTKGFMFKITLNEFLNILRKPCYYCGGEGYGIDRLDSSIGYLKGNIVSCCSVCNYMKQSYTEEQFIEQCTKIAMKWKVM